MNKINITLCILFVSTVCFSQKKDTVDVVQEAYIKSNKKVIETAAPLMDFLFKYQDTTKTVTQGDFNKLISTYGGKETKNGMIKEEGFEIVDWYIKASDGKKATPEKETIDETKSGLDTKTEEEKLKEKAVDELPGQIKSIIGGISYEEFKKMMQLVKPNATEADIKKEYAKIQKAGQKL